MAVKDLNIRLGLIFDERSLSRIEKQLQRSGEKLNRIGDALSLSISAPLAALGAGSIKAAGDIQSLTFALESQLGSAEAAKKELEALTEAAKNPGLGLEQAVRGSVRLQGVGFAAEEARGVLVELGNALAATGGTAEDLDRVSRQFAQMTSKGRVLQEDISVIAESMPGISQLMQKAFGTANVEAIREMGIGGKEFVLAITAAAKELPRVEGGIKNSIGNALDSIKQSAAKVGEAINNAFDIAGAAESFGNFLVGLADGFASLNPTLQTFVVYLGGALLAAGPLLKVMGGIKLLSSQLTTIWGGLVSVGGKLVNSFSSVGLGLNAIKWGPVIALAGGLAVAIYGVYEATKKADVVAEQFAASQEAITKETAKEVGSLNAAFAILTDETKGRQEKGKVIDQLLNQYPEYLRGIDLERLSVTELTKVQKSLNAEILRGVAERQKASAVNSIYEQQAAIILRIQQLRDGAKQTASEALLVDTGDVLNAGGVALAVIEKLQQKQQQLGNDAVKLASQFDKAFGTFNTTAGQAEAAEYRARDAYYAAKEAQEERIKTILGQEKAEKDKKAREKAISLEKAYLEVLSDIANERKRQSVLGAKDVIAEAEAIEGGLKKLLDLGFSPTSKAVQNLKNELKGLFGDKAAEVPVVPTLPTPTSVQSEGSTPTALPKAIDTTNLELYKSFAEQLGEINAGLTDGVLKFNEAFDQTAKLINEQGTAMQQVMFGVASAVQDAALSGETSFASLASAAVAAAAKVVRAWIQQGVAAAVSRALSSLPFPANLAAGALAGGLAAAAFTKALNSIGVPKFARGTGFASGGLSLVGEQGPELMSVPRGAQILSNQRTNRLLSGSGGGQMTGEFTVRGTDLVLVLDRVQAKNKRIR